MNACALSLDLESNVIGTAEIVYSCTKTLKYVQDHGMLFVYGIKCYIASSVDMTNPYKCCIIEDISNNKDFVTNLINTLETNKVLPIHIHDIIMDTIC